LDRFLSSGNFGFLNLWFLRSGHGNSGSLVSFFSLLCFWIRSTIDLDSRSLFGSFLFVCNFFEFLISLCRVLFFGDCLLSRVGARNRRLLSCWGWFLMAASDSGRILLLRFGLLFIILILDISEDVV
jgi:hypothetical protein